MTKRGEEQSVSHLVPELYVMFLCILRSSCLQGSRFRLLSVFCLSTTFYVPNVCSTSSPSGLYIICV